MVITRRNHEIMITVLLAAEQYRDVGMIIIGCTLGATNVSSDSSIS